MPSKGSAPTLISLFIVLATAITAQTAPLKTIEEVLAAFVEENGGEEGLAGVRSIRARGTITIEDEERKITILRKRPGLKRITVSWSDISVHRGFNGEVSWRMVEVLDGRKQLEILEGIDKERFELDLFILGRLYMTAEDGVEHKLVGVEYVGRIPSYVVESTFKGDVRRSYLDSRTLRVLKYEYSSGGENSVQTVEYLSKYTRIGKVWIAKLSEREVDGEPDGSIELDRIELNNGVFDTIFDVPQID